MIFVVKEKHLNDFQQVHCVRPKDLYARLGHRQPDTNFECSSEPIPMNQSKIDAMQDILSDYDRYMQYQANSNAGENQNETQSNDDSSQ